MDNIAILFDMDGVIVDNHEYHLKSWLKFFDEHGVSMSEEEYKQKVNGRTMDEILPKILNRNMGREEIRKLGGQKEETYREMYRPHIQPTPGLTHFLQNLKDHNIPFAVATSAPPANVDFTLGHTGLRETFSAIVDDTMVKEGKPAPEVYLTAAKAINMPPDTCIVFEDALLGIQAGKKANMKVVAVATTHTREELEAEGADLIIDDFSGLEMEKLLELLDD